MQRYNSNEFTSRNDFLRLNHSPPSNNRNDVYQGVSWIIIFGEQTGNLEMEDDEKNIWILYAGNYKRFIDFQLKPDQRKR